MRVATKRSGRGLAYADDIIDNRGSKIDLHESSAAEDAYLWMEITTSPLYDELSKAPGQGVAHINQEQAKAIAALLMRFVRTGRLATRATKALRSAGKPGEGKGGE